MLEVGLSAFLSTDLDLHLDATIHLLSPTLVVYTELNDISILQASTDRSSLVSHRLDVSPTDTFSEPTLMLNGLDSCVGLDNLM